MSKRFMVPVAVFVLLIRDGKILLLRRKNTGWYDGGYDLPAGHLEEREGLTTAALREIKEELGIDVAKHDLRFVSLFHSFFTEDGKEYLYATFQADTWQGEPTIMEPEKCDELRWCSLDELPENVTPGTRDGLKAYKAGVTFAESGF